MNSSVSLTSKSSALISALEETTVLDCWNSEDCNSAKKSAADLNCCFGSADSDSSTFSSSASIAASI